MKNIKKLVVIIILLLFVVIGIIFFISKNSNTVFNENIEYNYYKYYDSGNDKFGVIDNNGNVLISAIYEDIIIPNPINDVFFVVQNNNIENVVNKNNEEIFTKYEEVLPISVSGLIDEIPYEKNVLIYKENEKLGLLDFNGKKITNSIYSSIESLPYKEGNILCKTDKKIFLLNENGKKIIEQENDVEINYDGFIDENFSVDESGYIISKQLDDGIYYGYINYKGKEVLDIEFDEIKKLDRDFLIVKKNGQYGLYKNNKVIINCNYQEMNYEESLDLIFVRRGNKYGVLNKDGEIIIPVEYKTIENKGVFIKVIDFDDNIKKVGKDGKENVSYKDYNSIEKSKFDDSYIAIDNYYEYVLLDEKYNVILKNNYEFIENILPNLYIVKNSSGKYGIKNIDNINLIKEEYDVIQLINNTHVFETIDINNNMVFLFDISGNKIFEEKDAFIIIENGFIKVFCNEGVKYFTTEGKEVTSLEIYPNNSIIGFCEDGKWGFKNRNGEIIVEPIYDRISEINNKGYGGIKINDKWGIINSEGKIIVEPSIFIDDNISEPEFLNKFYKTYYATAGAFYILGGENGV